MVAAGKTGRVMGGVTGIAGYVWGQQRTDTPTPKRMDMASFTTNFARFFGLDPAIDRMDAHDDEYVDDHDDRDTGYRSRYGSESRLSDRYGRDRDEYVRDEDGYYDARDDEEVDRRPSSVGRYSPQHLRAIEEPVEPKHVHFVPKADFQDRFSEARDIGLAFRDNDIVTFDLSELDDVEATRYMDFAAGMAFALRGRIRQDGRSFTLIPDGVELPDTERDRMSV